MFQMLDNELGPECQFAFDHFRQNSEEKTLVGKGCTFGHDREGTKVDSFEVVISVDLSIDRNIKK